MKTSTFSCSITVAQSLNGITLDEALRTIWHFPKKTIHQWRMDKAIVVNGQLVPWKDPLTAGDRVHITIQQSVPSYPPSGKPVTILFEDEHLLIAHKPIGLDTHPNSEADTDTLANRVVASLLARNESGYAQPVHRLDRDTSGVILFAKHSAIKPLLDRMLEERDIKRTYWAYATGEVTQAAQTIDAPIGNDRHHAVRKRVSPSGQRAVTHYKKIRFRPKDRCTWLELTLDTGRTHQIRVHLAHIGHPLVGDTLYGGKRNALSSVQALHARKLEFIHPFTQETIIAEADDPRFS